MHPTRICGHLPGGTGDRLTLAPVCFSLELKRRGLLRSADEIRPDRSLVLPTARRHHLPGRSAGRGALSSSGPPQIPNLQVIGYAYLARDHARGLGEISPLPAFSCLCWTDQECPDLVLRMVCQKPRALRV